MFSCLHSYATEKGHSGAADALSERRSRERRNRHVPQRDKKAFAGELKEIWLAPCVEIARKRAAELVDKYEHRFSKAVGCLEDGLEDSLAFYAFSQLDSRKISSSNMLERLNREIRRRTSAVGIFPNEDAYVRLVTSYLMLILRAVTNDAVYIDTQYATILSRSPDTAIQE